MNPTLEVCFSYMKDVKSNYICVRVTTSMWNLTLHNLNLEIHSTDGAIINSKKAVNQYIMVKYLASSENAQQN